MNETHENDEKSIDAKILAGVIGVASVAILTVATIKTRRKINKLNKINDQFETEVKGLIIQP